MMSIVHPIIDGTCWKMCPHSEMKFREKNNLLNVFELMTGTEKSLLPRADPSKCVKEFRRSAAGEKLSEPKILRPGSVLLQTVDYLFKEVLSNQDRDFICIYDFIFDRLRSVRQDLVIQQLQFAEPEIAINVLEKCFQFYAYSDFVIKRNPKLSMNSHLNRTHMQECLSTLLKIYIECLCDNYRVGSICKNCSTYIACNLLYNLGSEDALLQALKLPKHVRQQIPLSMAFNISFKYIQKNFVGIQRDILDLIEKDQVFPVLSFLSNVDQFRADSIRILTVSHNSKRSQVPATVLKKWLFLDNEDRVIKLCVLYGMKATEDRNVVFVKSDFVIPDSFFLTDSYIPLQRVLRCLHD